jgi:hypothetical protein
MNDTKTDNQLNNGAVPIESTSTNTYLLVVWGTENVHYNFYVHLIECTDELNWDENKLRTLYWECSDPYRKDYKSNIITWLMNDNEVIETRLDVTYRSEYKLDIAISRGYGKYSMKKPIQIDPKR